MAEPKRTPGKAEGEVQAAGAEAKKFNDVGTAGKASLPGGEPGRTPGKAEGTVCDAEQALKSKG